MCIRGYKSILFSNLECQIQRYSEPNRPNNTRVKQRYLDVSKAFQSSPFSLVPSTRSASESPSEATECEPPFFGPLFDGPFSTSGGFVKRFRARPRYTAQPWRAHEGFTDMPILAIPSTRKPRRNGASSLSKWPNTPIKEKSDCYCTMNALFSVPEADLGGSEPGASIQRLRATADVIICTLRSRSCEWKAGWVHTSYPYE
jgi:hypothetical protein